MSVIIQQEITGCGIAAVANIIGKSYTEVKAKANTLGIFADDKALYSDTQYVRNLLREYNIQVSAKEISFKSWETLPDISLLAIKQHKENNLFSGIGWCLNANKAQLLC